MAVIRSHSQNGTRKPSVKKKPDEKPPKRKPKLSEEEVGDKVCVRAKICYLEAPQSVHKTDGTDEKDGSDRCSVSVAQTPEPNEVPVTGNVKATIEIFERRTSSCDQKPKTVPKPKVPEKKFALKAQELKIKNSDVRLTIFKKEEPKIVVDESQVLPQRKCDSMYETLNVPKTLQLTKVRSAEALPSNLVIQPNTSFLWRRTSHERLLTEPTEEDWRSTYDTVDPKGPETPQCPLQAEAIVKKKMPLPAEAEEEIYEELRISRTDDDGYEVCETTDKHETDDGYECYAKENIYECVPAHGSVAASTGMFKSML